jgi:pre-rRNA-processing protein TSR3
VTAVATTVIRHPKERIAKCSLRFLHGRPEMTFHRARPGFTFDASGFVLLEVGAPPLTTADHGHPLLLLDATWRWLPQLRAAVTGAPLPRSIPAGIATAYPRTSKLFDDPAGGLASIEALYLARLLLGDPDPSLHGYHWKEEFLANVARVGW